MEDRLPLAPEELDAAWLTAALQPRSPGVRVADARIARVDEVTNTHVRLDLVYDGSDHDLPSRMFAKLPPLDPDRRAALGASNMGPRESRFYADLAPQLSFRVPTAYVTEHDDRDRSFVVLLEDLDETGCTVSDGTRGVAVDAAARALEELAEMHAVYEDPARRDAYAGWIPEATHGSRYGADLLRYGLDHHRDRLSDDFASIAELYIDDIPLLQAAWHAPPITVVHGDPHLGNLFDDHGRTGFLDWGLINVSSPMRDVSYFLCMALDIADRRAREHELIRHYLDARSGFGGDGVADLSFDAAWLAHRVHAAYTVPACCQVVTFPDDVSDRRRTFADAFLARAEAAIGDLDARGALHQVVGR
jgi:aminoglycoside phosphotransferase (APT) family kinase protein